MYEAQLNAYAYIAERVGISPVSGIGLIYYEPQTDLGIEDVDDVLLEYGFIMRFRAKLVSLTLDPDGIIPPLLKQARRIDDLREASKGKDGCRDCARVRIISTLVMAEPG